MSVIQIPARSLILPVAPVARGKSTLGRAFAQQWGTGSVICPDTIRGELCPGPVCTCENASVDCPAGESCQCQNARVFKISAARINSRLAKKQGVYFDGTNLSPQTRRGEIARGKRFGLPVVALLATSLPVETLLTRNASRTRQVPEEPIRRMFDRHASLSEEKLLSEGFDSVLTWDDETTVSFV